MRQIKRNHYKDYASDAFRVLGKYGSSAEYKRMVLEQVEQKHAELAELGAKVDAPIGKPTEAEIIRAEEAIEDAKATLQDIESAEEALKICAVRDIKQSTLICKAVRAIYMAYPDRLPKHREIMDSVIAFSILVPCDRATVYRWLSFARTMFARERGLRIRD